MTGPRAATRVPMRALSRADEAPDEGQEIDSMDARRVLVVDDDPTIRDVLHAMLGFEGFEVHLASDGVSALAAADELRPDVVLLDVMMPGMSGFEVCRLLKAERDAPKVVMVTAKATVEDRTAGLGAGADAYLTKPFSPMQVLSLVGAEAASA